MRIVHMTTPYSLVHLLYQANFHALNVYLRVQITNSRVDYQNCLKSKLKN